MTKLLNLSLLGIARQLAHAAIAIVIFVVLLRLLIGERCGLGAELWTLVVLSIFLVADAWAIMFQAIGLRRITHGAERGRDGRFGRRRRR